MNTIKANIMLSPCILFAAVPSLLSCALLVVWLVGGWYICTHCQRARKIFADYLQTVERWERELLGGND